MSFILDEKPKFSKPNNTIRFILILVVVSILMAIGLAFFTVNTDSATPVRVIEHEAPSVVN